MNTMQPENTRRCAMLLTSVLRWPTAGVVPLGNTPTMDGSA